MPPNLRVGVFALFAPEAGDGKRFALFAGEAGDGKRFAFFAIRKAAVQRVKSTQPLNAARWHSASYVECFTSSEILLAIRAGHPWRGWNVVFQVRCCTDAFAKCACGCNAGPVSPKIVMMELLEDATKMQTVIWAIARGILCSRSGVALTKDACR